MSFILPFKSIAGVGILGCVMLAPGATIAQQTRADAEKDPLLKAMLTELDRSMTQLQLPGFAKPFFIQYRIEDVDDYETKAEFGASEGGQRSQRPGGQRSPCLPRRTPRRPRKAAAARGARRSSGLARPPAEA